jgi:hypothetical protein
MDTRPGCIGLPLDITRMADFSQSRHSRGASGFVVRKAASRLPVG